MNMETVFQRAQMPNKNRLIVGALGWGGTASGLLGATLLAMNSPLSPYGYIFFVISSISLLAWAWLEKISHQALLQAAFTVINLIGVYHWLVAGAGNA